MAVGQHVQLVACIPLSLLLGLGDGGLVTWCQLYVYLHILVQKKDRRWSFGRVLAAKKRLISSQDNNM